VLDTLGHSKPCRLLVLEGTELERHHVKVLRDVGEELPRGLHPAAGGARR
jgi:hypothetical protein